MVKQQFVYHCRDTVDSWWFTCWKVPRINPNEKNNACLIRLALRELPQIPIYFVVCIADSAFSWSIWRMPSPSRPNAIPYGESYDIPSTVRQFSPSSIHRRNVLTKSYEFSSNQAHFVHLLTAMNWIRVVNLSLALNTSCAHSDV